MMTNNGCMLPSLALREQEHRSSPAAAVSVTPRPKESPVSEAPPDGCGPILVWGPGASSPDVYLVKRKTPKSAALPPPPKRMTGPAPAPATDPEVYLVKRKTPKSAALPPLATRTTEPAPASATVPDVYLVKRKTPKSAALLLPLAPRTTEPAPAPATDPEVYLVKRKTPKSAALLPPPAPRTEPAAAAAQDPDVCRAVKKKAKPRLPRMTMPAKRCRHCATSSTPQWREGPEGSGTLCNACGCRYRQGRLLPEYRPRASPTFDPSVHANRHRQVVKLHHRQERKGKNRRRGPPPEQQPQPTPTDEDGARLRVIGDGDSADDGPWSGGDDLMRHELPLPWRWHNNNNSKDCPPPVDNGAGGMGGDSADAWCPFCAQN